MKLKVITVMVSMLVLASILTLAFAVQPVKALGTIYIRADGSVDPPTANITSVDNVTYTFTDDINDSIVVERSNIIIDGNGYTLNGTGTGKFYGFTVEAVDNVTIQNVNIMGFVLVGVRLISSSNNSVYGNNITNNSNGIYLSDSMNNTISGNNITNNSDGISLNTVFFTTSYENNITNNNEGIYLWDSSNNTISENNITNNYCGIYFESSSNNSIYHNNFINNTNQVSVDLGDVNTWDNGYPSGGNYWSNYTDVDQYSGPYQNETGSDGFWDNPYIIDENNQDNYPWTTVIPEFPTWASTLPIFIVLTVAIIIYKRRLLKTPIH